ncbi:MAG: recombinase family protein [Syntrophobacteraceae bacterium]|jgi:DNA invertase Pin-like site-specific DNA recombinase/translation initiation factor 2 beta subunit (eIF-2beta)/eIF-5
MKTAVGYTRVSSSSQASPEKTSLERQAEKIELQARLKEYNLLKIYKEPGISGATMERPALQELLADAEQKRFDAVIVWDISRFGRNLLHLKQNTERLKELGIAFLAIDNGIDTANRDKTGELLLNILASIYEFELETIKERTQGGRDAKRKKKEYFPGKTAYGYRWNAQELRVETVEAEKPIVERIFKEYIYLNKSIPTITKGLQDDHVPTRSGTKWGDSVVHRILRNPCYTGTYIVNQHITNAKGEVIGEKPESEWVYHDCDPLITPTDWQDLQKKLDKARENNAGAPNPESQKYIADGLLRCGICGSTMRLRHTRRNKAGKCHSYYQCYWNGKSQRAAEIKGKKLCEMVPIPAAIMDSHLFELRLRLKLGMDWERKYEDKVNPSIAIDLDKSRQRVENIKISIASNKTAMTNNDRTQYRKDYDPDKYIARNNELNLERANLQRELAEAEREHNRYQQLFESEQNFVRLAADKDKIMELFRQLVALPVEQKRRLLKGLVDGEIEVTPLGPLDVSEEGNALNGWTAINWKYNPAIIQEILGVIILDVDETTGEGSGGIPHHKIPVPPEGGSPMTETITTILE